MVAKEHNSLHGNDTAFHLRLNSPVLSVSMHIVVDNFYASNLFSFLIKITKANSVEEKILTANQKYSDDFFDDDVCRVHCIPPLFSQNFNKNTLFICKI